jgi:hypothetical protein
VVVYDLEKDQWKHGNRGGRARTAGNGRTTGPLLQLASRCDNLVGLKGTPSINAISAVVVGCLENSAHGLVERDAAATQLRVGIRPRTFQL